MVQKHLKSLPIRAAIKTSFFNILGLVADKGIIEYCEAAREVRAKFQLYFN